MNQSLTRVILALVIGLVLVVWPDMAGDYLVITIGVVFMIPGIIGLIKYFTSGNEPGVKKHFPLEFLGSLLLGFWLVVMPGFFADILMVLLGVILVVAGVQQVSTLVVARRWKAVPVGFFIIPTLILITGLIVLFDPTSARRTVFIIVGITSLVYAAAELLNWFMFTRVRPQIPTHEEDIVDAEILEDSDQ